MPLTVGLDYTHAVLNRTGIGRYPAALLPALQRLPELRMEPIVAFEHPAKPRAGRIAQGLVREGVYYPRLFERRARAAGAGVLHCATLAPVRSRSLPLIITVHDLLPFELPELFTRETRVHTRLSARFLGGAERVIANSETVREQVLEHTDVDPERVVTIRLGVDERFAPRAVGTPRPYVLCVGTLEPRKNLLGALRAFAAGAPEEFELVITGGRGWQDHEAFRLALEPLAGRVRLTGFVTDDELVELYSGASCFLFPSLAEGTGLPPLEAMACGAPVVASSRPAMPEILGDAPLLADPRDDGALADALRRVLTDEALAADLRRRGIERAARFRWEDCARATADLYREAAESRP